VELHGESGKHFVETGNNTNGRQSILIDARLVDAPERNNAEAQNSERAAWTVQGARYPEHIEAMSNR